MSWAIEEHVEDAIVAHLKASLSGDLRVYAAGVEDEVTLPAVMVYCGDGQNVSESGLITGRRQFDVRVELRCEAAPLLDSSGAVLVTSRDRYREMRDQVSSVLFDNALHAPLNSIMPDRVLFSMAHTTATTGRTVEERSFVSAWTVEVIAQGVAE